MDKFWICLVLLAVAWGGKAQSDEADFSNDENWSVNEVEKLGILDDNKGNVEENIGAQEVFYDYELDSDINAQQNKDNNNDENVNGTEEKNNEEVEIPNAFDSDLNVQNEIDLLRNENDDNINGNLEENEKEPEVPEDYDFGDDRHGLYENEDDNYGFDYNVLKDDQDDLKNFFADDNDYQYEDNRSDLKEEQDNKEIGKFSDNEGTFNENDIDKTVEIEFVGKNEDTENLKNIVDDPQPHEVNDFEEVVQPQFDEQLDIDTILKETKDILNELDNSQDTDLKKSDVTSDENVEKIVQESQEEAVEASQGAESEEKLLDDENEDTLDNVYNDLNSDLDKLIETIDKLQSDDNLENSEEIVSPEFNNVDNENNDSEKASLQINDQEIEENNLGDLFHGDDDQIEKDGGNDLSNHLESENDYIDEPKIDDTADENIETENNENDASFEKEQLQNENDEPKESDSKTQNIENITVRTKLVDDLTSSELNDLMDQFALEHSDDLDFKAPGFDRNIAPVYITLNTDEPVIVNSPNYPSPYPTNNIVDWMLDGNGMGIEMNITDFAVNGALGDYLLVKPGGVDESGEEGLIFSYTLDKPRMYRFLSVDKMFVRFESKLGMMFFRGFSMSVKLIGPRQEIEETVPSDDDIQEEVAPPTSTLTVSLGGVTLQHFKLIQEEFRLIIADMATMYINAQGINPGLESTINVTRITRAVMCNLNWPNFETCSQVSFGVPLKYEDVGDDDEEHLTQEELQEMWDMFVFTDPFRSRLARLGVTEFAAPNDRAALSLWTVLVLGVLISVMLLGLMLWRYSCREDYKRMPSFSDADSVYDKRGLDLYPTPHQTLPPLYSQADYKWSDHHDARVDIGGFGNKSYVPDELGELDSEDDVISQHRNHDIRPKDIYQV